MPIRVLIVDDSPFVREVLRTGLAMHEDIDVVAEGADGRRALELVREHRPDVVTMDVLMPMVGGLEAIERIMEAVPTPIIVVADAASGVERLAMRALEAGALEVYPKPSHGFGADEAAALAALIRAAARAGPGAGRHREPAPSARAVQRRLARARALALVASTGGPQTLRRVLEQVPPAFPVPIAIVQHTAVGFTAALASWLDAACGLDVRVARAGDPLRPGTALVAPCGHHLVVRRGGVVGLLDGPPENSHRPAGSVLLRSIAEVMGAYGAGCVFTGMGNDGADGLRRIEAAGGLAMVEEPNGAVLEGMPRASLAATRAPWVASASDIGALLAGVEAGEA